MTQVFTNRAGNTLRQNLLEVGTEAFWWRVCKFFAKVRVVCGWHNVEKMVMESKDDATLLKKLKELHEPAAASWRSTTRDRSQWFRPPKPEPRRQVERALSRISDIEDDIKKFKPSAASEQKAEPVKQELERAFIKPRTIQYLDLGSGDGRITTEIASFLELDAKTTHGVDIMADGGPNVAKFTYRQYDGIKLPTLPAIDLATVFMTACHFADPVATFSSLRDVMAATGMVIIREHNVTDRRMQVFLDLVHAVYTTVVGKEMSPDEFAERYVKGEYARYRPMSEWKSIAERAGFSAEREKTTGDMFGSCYIVLRIPLGKDSHLAIHTSQG